MRQGAVFIADAKMMFTLITEPDVKIPVTLRMNVDETPDVKQGRTCIKLTSKL